MSQRLSAEIRKVNLKHNGSVEIIFVWPDEKAGWAPRNCFDVLRGDRLRQFCINQIGVNDPEKLKQLAPDSKGHYGVENNNDPTWVRIEKNSSGPDTFSIKVRSYDD